MRVQSVRKIFFPRLILPVSDLATMRAKQWRDSHYPLVDHFINSSNFFSSVCIDIFRRKLMLITLGTERVKGCICISIPTPVIPPCGALREPLVIPGTLSRTTDCTIFVPNQLSDFGRSRFQSSSAHSDSTNWSGNEAATVQFFGLRQCVVTCETVPAYLSIRSLQQCYRLPTK